MVMKFFIDSANIKELIEAEKLGFLDGVTTNPTLVSKENISGKQNLYKHYKTISDLCKGDVSVEIISTNLKSIISEGYELSKINSNIVLKIPITTDGLKAIRFFYKQGIKTNCTLVFSIGQAILAAKCGATYVSIFVGRLDDISSNGINMLQNLFDIYQKFNYKSNILAASIRHPMHIINCAEIGINYITSPLNPIKQLLTHPMSEIGLQKFLDDYKNCE